MAVTPPENEPSVRRKLADEVFDRLKAMIVSGERSPGESLPSERELMARFGVGRPAIREAMQALANLGLVTISHGERARVREIRARAAINQDDMVGPLMTWRSAGGRVGTECCRKCRTRRSRETTKN